MMALPLPDWSPGACSGSTGSSYGGVHRWVFNVCNKLIPLSVCASVFWGGVFMTLVAA